MNRVPTFKEKQAASIEALKSQWRALLSEFALPDDKQFSLWLHLHGNKIEVVLFGITKAAQRAANSGLADEDHAIRYASACMNRYCPPRFTSLPAIVRPRLPEKLFVEEKAA